MVLTGSLKNLYSQYKDIVKSGQPLSRIELKMQQAQEDIFKQCIKTRQNAALPAVTLYSSIAAQNLNNSFTPCKDYWYPYNYVGLKASMPLFNGFL